MRWNRLIPVPLLILVALIFVLERQHMLSRLPRALSITPTNSSAFSTTNGSTMTHYVSRNGNNTDGASWNTAWNELSAIDWSTVSPGDTILVDGGTTACTSPFNANFTSPYNFPSPKPGVTCGMLYNTTLTVGTSGTTALPITIKLASDLGRNGTVVVFGGRLTSLPDCTTTTYTASYSGNNLLTGISLPSRSHITIDGTKRSGIVIYGAQIGIDLKSSSTSFITLQNLEIFDNGIFGNGANPNGGTFATSGYGSDNPGIYLNGSNITISRDLIHDNGQDDIQDEPMSVPESNVTITDSWLYFSRENPLQPAWGFNTGNNQPCQHPDGIQTWNGGTQETLTVQNSIFGPYLGQGVYPADKTSGARWNNLTLTNVLFFNILYDSVNGDDNSTTGWTIRNVTSYKQGPAADGILGDHLDGIRGLGHVLTDSIFVNGANDTRISGLSGSGNLYYNTDPVPGGTETDPQFVTPLGDGTRHWSDFQSVDLTAQCATCSGKGATLHRLTDILDRIDALDALGSVQVIAPSKTILK